MTERSEVTIPMIEAACEVLLDRQGVDIGGNAMEEALKAAMSKSVPSAIATKEICGDRVGDGCGTAEYVCGLPKGHSGDHYGHRAAPPTSGRIELVPVEPAPTYIESSGRWKWSLPDHARFPGCCTDVVSASREWWEYAPSEAKPHPGSEALQLRGGKWYWTIPALPSASACRDSGPLKLDTDRQVFFYEQDHYYLSNFSAFKVSFAGIIFDTAEHAYHWNRFPHGSPERTIIRESASAHDAFRFAQEHKASQLPNWDAIKVRAMGEILRAKVRQHEYVRRKLLQTGDRELIENSWRDAYWGWGENRDGQNMLGKLWMEVRAELRAVDKTPRGKS